MDVTDYHIAFWLREFSDIETLVVANGEIPDSELSQIVLHSNKRIICCDGALGKLLSINIVPNIVVGDGDSLNNNDLLDYEIPYHQDKSEEYNDLQKALKYCLQNSYNNVLLLGCAGLREDHFLANLSIMVMYSSQFANISMLTENGVFDVFENNRTFSSQKKMQVSVFMKDTETKLTFHGLKYLVCNRPFYWFWEGSLNEALGDAFEISANTSMPVIVYRTL